MTLIILELHFEVLSKLLFCLLGKYQARVLSESMLTPSDYQKEVNYQLVTGKVESLGSFFNTLCPGTEQVIKRHVSKSLKLLNQRK